MTPHDYQQAQDEIFAALDTVRIKSASISWSVSRPRVSRAIAWALPGILGGLGVAGGVLAAYGLDTHSTALTTAGWSAALPGVVLGLISAIDGEIRENLAQKIQHLVSDRYSRPTLINERQSWQIQQWGQQYPRLAQIVQSWGYDISDLHYCQIQKAQRQLVELDKQQRRDQTAEENLNLYGLKDAMEHGVKHGQLEKATPEVLSLPTPRRRM